jgi:hypothetical protein
MGARWFNQDCRPLGGTAATVVKVLSRSLGSDTPLKTKTTTTKTKNKKKKKLLIKSETRWRARACRQISLFNFLDGFEKPI